MKITFQILMLLFCFTSCGVITSNKNNICKCCDKSFTNLDSAINCLVKTPDEKLLTDYRLFLFAFVTKDLKKYQELGWNIFNDQEIISTAKQRYLLIIQDINRITFPNQMDASLLIKTIKNHKGEPYFVITNGALNPFAEWTSSEQKDIIIERLEVGNGP